MKNFKLSDRAAYLRDLAVNVKPHNEYLKYRAIGLSCLGKRACPDPTNRYAYSASGLIAIVKNYPVFMEDCELIVGQAFPDYSSEPFTDICGSHVRITDTPECREGLYKSGFTPEEAEIIIDEYLHPRVKDSPEPTFPREEQMMDEEWSAAAWCICRDHNILSYESVLKYGYEGIHKRICELEKKNGESPMYTAAKQICVAASSIGYGYLFRVMDLIEECEVGSERWQELRALKAALMLVPRKPARNFTEAIQSLLFAHQITCFEDLSINANSLGRLDQILYPYYEADIKSGAITPERAFELVCALWIKLYRDYDVQQSCVGGVKPDGTSAVNELSYMMLDATEQLGFIRCLSVRYSENSPRDFVKRAIEVVGHLQKGVPFFFNDSVMIPALESVGIETADARDYSQIGCVETCIPGKSNPHAVSGKIGLLKAMEYALNDGKSATKPITASGVDIRPTETLTTYDALKREVFKHISNFIDVSARRVIAYQKKYETEQVKPYKSMLTEGCLESGRDFNARGAKYDYYQMMLAGIPNLADSLAAMKKLVYTERKYTLAEIVYQIRNNFPNEAIRQDLINNAPKYGNDIDEVDEIAAEIMNYCCDELEKASKRYGYSFHAQPFTFLWLIDHGANTGATPDGRRAGDNIAYSCSPMQGYDFEGLTAVFNSIAKLPSRRAPGTTSAIVEIDPGLFSDRNTDLLTDMMLAIAEMGVANVQFNVTDVKTLEDAKRHPERHKSLAVRVSGFSQKFYLLNTALQDHIIARTKHKEM